MNYSKIIPAIIMIGFIGLLFGNIAIAATLTDIAGAPTGGPTDMQGVLNLVGVVVLWMFYTLMAVSAIFVLLGGFTYLTAGGDPEKVGAAKNYIIYAVVAIVVGVIAFSFVKIISGVFGFTIS